MSELGFEEDVLVLFDVPLFFDRILFVKFVDRLLGFGYCLLSASGGFLFALLDRLFLSFSPEPK